MGLDLARLKQRQEENAISGSRLKLKKKPAQNFLRFFKFTHKVTEADVKAGFFTKDKIGKTVDEIDRAVTMQFGFAGKKPVLATKATLEKYNKLNDSSNAANQEAAKKIKPSKKFLMNAVNMDEKPRKMRHIALASTAYNDVLAVIMNPEFGEKVLGASGRDFIVTHDPEKPPAEQYKVILRDQSKSVKMDPALDKKVLDFYSDAGLKEVGLSVKADANAAPAEEPEETEPAEEETTEEVSEETTEEVTEETTEAETEPVEGEEGPADEETGAEGEEGEAGEETSEASEEPTEEPEEPAEEPAKPAKKAAKPLPPKKKGKK